MSSDIESNTEINQTKHLNEVTLVEEIVSHVNTEHKCEHCSFTGSTESDLRIHIRNVHGETFKCTNCEQTFQESFDLEKHISDCHTPSQCHLCGLSLASKNILREHVDQYHSETSTSCNYCNFVANNDDILKSHMYDCHSEIVIIHTVAQQIDNIHESSREFEAFKAEVTATLKQICETQVQIKQELFVLRNEQNRHMTLPMKTLSQSSQTQEKLEHEIIFTKQDAQMQSLPDALIPDPQPPSSDLIVDQEAEAILFVTDSIGDIIDAKEVESKTKKKIVKKVAHSAVSSTDSNIVKKASPHPELNFTDIISNQVAESEYHSLIIQAGAEDITNLNTEKNQKQYLEYFKQETIVSAENIFSAAERALEIHPSLKKVGVMNHIPRCDPTSKDPLGLKAELSSLFNSTLSNSWMRSKYKSNIVIGEHNIECIGAKKEARYRQVGTSKFDGIHLLGRLGKRAFTDSVLNIADLVGFTKPQDIRPVLNKVENAPTIARPSYSILTQNRFSVLSDQGNC